MNRKELQDTLHRQCIAESAYSLEAGNFDPDEALCLRQNDNKWIVYYSERGLQTGKIIFQSEADACAYILEELHSDPTMNKDWKSGFDLSSDA